MKNDKIISKIALLIFGYAVFVNDISGQVNWTYYHDTPVLSMDTSSNMWGAYGQPTVIIENDTIKMWYAVAEGVNQFDPVARGRIHYAWSIDGITWTKHPNNPVLDVSGAGNWDGEWLDTPEILKDGVEYKLYYYGDSTLNQGQSNTAIGLATSIDGINWTRQGKVLQKGVLGDWDGKFIESPATYFNDEIGLYALLYTGVDTARYAQLGLALSVDGYNFIKYSNYPVVPVGNYPSWNDMACATASLIETNGIIELFYSGISYHNGRYDSARVGYAVTLNGINWIQYPNNPVLTDYQNKGSSFWAISVVYDSLYNAYKMYYEDFWLYGDPNNPDTTNAIFYATAPRDVLFSSNCNVDIISDTTISTGSSIQLWATGGDYYTWEPFDNLNNANIPNPIATPDSTTTYTVLIVSNSCITKAEVTITVDSGMGIEPNNFNKKIEIFPNPSSSELIIQIDGNTEKVDFNILNAIGQVVLKGNFIEKTTVQTRNFTPGIYIIKLNNGKTIEYKNFIKE